MHDVAAAPPMSRSATGLGRPGGMARAVPWPWWLLAVLLILLRSALLVEGTLPNGAFTGDESTNDALARSLLSGQGLSFRGNPWILRPPGWPMVMAGLIALPTPDRPTVVAFQGLCDGVAALTWAGIALAVFGRRRFAAAAFLAVLLWPPFFRESLLMQSDPSYTMMLALMTASFLGFVSRPVAGRAVLAGAVAGLTMLVRPSGLICFVGLVAGWLLWRPRQVLRMAPVLAVLFATALCAISPWAIRNAIVFNRFVPLSLGSGEQFFQGSLLATKGRWVHGVTAERAAAAVAREAARAGRPLDVFERDRALMKEGLAQWRSDPLRSMQLVLLRAARLCLVPFDPGNQPFLRSGFLMALIALYVLALPRVVEAWAQGDPVRAFPGLLGAALGLSVLAHLPFYTNSRYMEPMRPLVLVLAATTLVGLLPQRLGARDEPAQDRRPLKDFR